VNHKEHGHMIWCEISHVYVYFAMELSWTYYDCYSNTCHSKSNLLWQVFTVS